MFARPSVYQIGLSRVGHNADCDRTGKIWAFKVVVPLFRKTSALMNWSRVRVDSVQSGPAGRNRGLSVRSVMAHRHNTKSIGIRSVVGQ